MPWLWLLAILIAVVLGFWFGAWGAGLGYKEATQQLLRAQAMDRNNFLSVIRREIANHLMQRDPRAFEGLYERTYDEVARYVTFSKAGLLAEFRSLCERYPQYSDFDFIGTREHVLYPDALALGDDVDTGEHFRNIVRFQALNALLDDNWKHMRATTEDDRKHLHEYVKRVLDTRLRRKLERAIQAYYGARRDELDFENDDYSIIHVSHVAELRKGIHLKKSDEYGLHALFEEHERYYGSDRTFEQQRHLDRVRDSYLEGD